MATKKLKLTGIAYYAKVFEENRDKEGFEGAYEECNGATTIDVDLDADQLEKLQDSGSAKEGRPSPDNEGYQRVKFIRKWESPYEGLGGAPKVVKEDGTEWDFDVDGYIGNGSDVEIVISVYDLKKSKRKGTRLDKVKVTHHKPYNPEADADDEEETPKVTTKTTPTKAQAKAATKTTPKSVSKTSQLEDDEIPF